MNRIGTLSLASYLSLTPAVLAAPQAPIADTCQIDSIRFDAAASALVLTGSGQIPSWTQGKGAAADRFFFDLPSTGGSPTYLKDPRVQVLNPRHPSVKQIRFAPNRTGVVRIVIEGASPAYAAARLKMQGANWRLTIPVEAVQPEEQSERPSETQTDWPTYTPPVPQPTPRPLPAAKPTPTPKPLAVTRFPVSKSAPPTIYLPPPPPNGAIFTTADAPPPEALEPAPRPTSTPAPIQPEEPVTKRPTPGPELPPPDADEPTPQRRPSPAPVAPPPFAYGTPNIHSPITTAFGEIYWRLSHNFIAPEFPGHAEPTWSMGLGLFKHLSLDALAMIQHKYKDQEIGLRYQFLDEAEGAPLTLASRISYLTHQMGMMTGDVTLAKNDLLPNLGIGLVGRYFSYVSDFKDKGPMTAGGAAFSYALQPGFNLVGDCVIPFNGNVLQSHGFVWSGGIQWWIPDTPHVLTLKGGRMGAQSSFGRSFPHALDEYVIGFEYNVGLDLLGLGAPRPAPNAEQDEEE